MSALSSTPLCILTDSQWDSLFSKDLYKKVEKKDPKVLPTVKNFVSRHCLKYLIALNQPDQMICQYIDKVKRHQTHQINSPFTQHKITALHIAIMKNREEVVKKLIDAGAKVDVPDEHGWFPIHHAAVVSNDLVQLLLKNNAKADTKTKLNGTYQDLIRLTRIQIVRDQAFYSYKSLSSELEEIDTRGLSERLKIGYRDDCMWPEKLLYDLWTAVEKVRGRSFNQKQIRDDLYPKLKSNPPKIIFNETLLLGSTTTSVIAGQPIAPFALVGEYTGEIVKKEKGVNLTYSFLLEDAIDFTISVDAERMGNWTRYMNDGFPNVFSFDLFNTAGQKCRKVFFVADPEGIKEGDSLLIDYSWMYFTLKWGNYVLMEKEKIRNFFRKFKDHYTRFIKLYNDFKCPANPTQHVNYLQLVEFKALEARLHYPFQTPLALMDLVFTQTIDPGKWEKFLEKEKYGLFKSLFEEGNPYQLAIEKLLSSLVEFDWSAKKLSKEIPGQEIMKKIRQLFLDNKDNSTVTELKDKLEKLNKFFISKSLNIRTNFTYKEIEDISKETDNVINELFGLKL